MRKGRGKCKEGGGGGGSSNLWVSSPREEDRARNLDKADKDGDRTEENNGGGGGEKRKSRVRQTVGAGWEHEGESTYASTK